MIPFFYFSPLRGGGGLSSIESRGRLGGRARARGASGGKAAAADQEAGLGFWGGTLGLSDFFFPVSTVDLLGAEPLPDVEAARS